MGVPQLMMILEPNIVWEHTKAFIPAVGREVEANVTPGEFFEGWHKGGRRAHGVYEGSYWELMGDCDELAEMLRKMSKAPPLLDEPVLELPPPPELPSWEDFRPNLHIIPGAPSLPPLKLPPFRAPILESEVPFVEPEYLPVPTVPQAPKEEPIPIFIPPEFLKLEPLVEPPYVEPAPPVLSESPRPPTFGRPEHGHDWTGERPFQLDPPSRDAFLKEAASKRIMDTSRWAHPPTGLPPLPQMEALDMDMRDLELEPIPKLELAWMGGPEPDPPYCSMPATPEALSRHSSRPTSGVPTRPMSGATNALSRPVSAVTPPPAESPAAPSPAPGSRQPSARSMPSASASSRTRVSSATPSLPAVPEPAAALSVEATDAAPTPMDSELPRSRTGTGTGVAEESYRTGTADGAEAAAEPEAVAGPADEGTVSSKAPSPSPSPAQTRPASAKAAKAAVAAVVQRSAARSSPPVPAKVASEPNIYPSRWRGAKRSGGEPSPPPLRPEDIAWEEARSVGTEASGAPRLWLNFTGPFAELPPIMMQPRPEPGPEPAPEDFPHEPLEELPVFTAPVPLEPPVYEEPPQPVPAWMPPCEPRPVGFLRGAAPVIICDVSGTMHPRQQGRFRDMKRCAVELLDPEGEIATVAAGFDVITFSGGAWSWSAGYGERMLLLQSSQVLYAGRQVGGRFNAKTAPGAIAGGGGGAGSRSGSPERPGSSRMGAGLALMPTQPDLLSDAQRWVANWPEAVGQTNLMNAFNLADQHGGADCWYVLSDGLAHDQNACLEFLHAREQAGLPMPVIHAVGFVPSDAGPDNAGERFLRGIAELTGGSYQRYTPDVVKAWQPGRGFVPVDLRNETAEQREERAWAEMQLRAERRKNIRLGIHEPLDVTMERVAAMHAAMRVAPAVRANEAAVAEAQRRHAEAVEAVRVANERALAEAIAAHEAAVEAARNRNQARVDGARDAFLAAHNLWEQTYLDRLQDWEDTKAMLERQREEEMAAAEAAQAAEAAYTHTHTHPHPPLHAAKSMPTLPTPAPVSRPTSATLYEKRKSSNNSPLVAPSPRLVASDLRAFFAAAEYDLAYGLEEQLNKLSPAATPQGSRHPSRPVSAVPVQQRSPHNSAVGMMPSSISVAQAAAAAAAAAAPSSPKPLRSATKLQLDDGLSTEYLQTIAEDLAEASAPVDAVFVGGLGGRVGGSAAARPAASAAEADTVDDDGLDVRPSSSRMSGSRRDRDQDQDRRTERSTSDAAAVATAAAAASPSRPVSARPSSSSPSRPTSARPLSSHRSSSAVRPPSARVSPSRPVSAVRSRSLLEGLAPPPPLPEPSAPLQPLRGETSEDFKRRILPSSVVDAHDAGNAARLESIRRRWEALVAEDAAAGQGAKVEMLQRNAERLAAYRDAVYDAYANSLMRDIVYGGAVRVATNLLLMDDADARYKAALVEWEAENARLREVHLVEVADKRAKEEAHEQAHARWQEGCDAMIAAHEEDKERAKAEHVANLQRLREEWAAKKAQVDEMNAARLAESEHMYAKLVESVKEINKQHKAEHTELLRQRKEIEQTNLGRLAEAKIAHKVRLEARAADNERAIKMAKEEHQGLCARLSEEYEESRVQAEADHAELCAFLRAANDQLTEEARRRYQEALAEVQAAYEAECAAVREAHERELDRVQRFNQDIWPKVHVARLAQAELARVQAFAEHIRFCANKFELGVNLMPNTPNYDRVVEMQALTEALAKAFPDTPSSELPWPEHERRLEPGTGWLTPPAPRQLTYRDPVDIITKIAKGKLAASGGSSPAPGSPSAASPRMSAAGHMRGPSPTAAEAPSAQPEEQPVQTLRRPLSAGRARFANVLNAEGNGARPQSALTPSVPGGRFEAWATAAPSALSSPGGGGGIHARPHSAAGYANPSAWRRSNTTVLRTASPRGPGASNLGSSAATVAAAVAAAAVAATNNVVKGGQGRSRPSTAHGPAPPLQQPQSPAQQAIPPLALARPRSAGPGPLPARVAVDVQPLQASVARSRAQAGAHALSSAALAGFAKDVPRLRYPEVDVQQPLTVSR